MFNICILDIKTEPSSVPEKQKWSLIAVSEAARKWRSMYVLEPDKTYTVGRKKTNKIQIPSGLLSKNHCILQVTDNEVIMKDEVCIVKTFDIK